MKKYHGNTVGYWKRNAEENYLTTPISVLKYITVLEEQAEQLHKTNVSGSLPSLDDATKVAARISEEAIKPPLDAKEQAMFIAGFQECIKWLNVVFSNDH